MSLKWGRSIPEGKGSIARCRICGKALIGGPCKDRSCIRLRRKLERERYSSKIKK